MQACLPDGVKFSHVRGAQVVKLNIAGAQLHSGHLLL